MCRFCYRPLHRYKYQLVEEFTCSLDRTFESAPEEHPFVRIATDGTLTIRKHYAWDGTSGVPDTRRNLRASMVHDALYQMMRDGILDANKDRDWSDRLFQAMCVRDGVWPPIAAMYYQALKRFGATHARPRKTETPTRICIED